jgi:hypothetical protein
MMPKWTGEVTPEELQGWKSRVQEDLENGGAIFGTKVGKAFPLSQFKEAIEYSLNNATEGKAIFHPQE